MQLTLGLALSCHSTLDSMGSVGPVGFPRAWGYVLGLEDKKEKLLYAVILAQAWGCAEGFGRCGIRTLLNTVDVRLSGMGGTEDGSVVCTLKDYAQAPKWAYIWFVTNDIISCMQPCIRGFHMEWKHTHMEWAGKHTHMEWVVDDFIRWI